MIYQFEHLGHPIVLEQTPRPVENFVYEATNSEQSD